MRDRVRQIWKRSGTYGDSRLCSHDMATSVQYLVPLGNLGGSEICEFERPDPFGRQGGVLLQGSFYEVSLALVGVASLA